MCCVESMLGKPTFPVSLDWSRFLDLGNLLPLFCHKTPQALLIDKVGEMLAAEPIESDIGHSSNR